MNEKRAIAGAILDISKKAVTTERGQQHGDAEASFAAIGEMWVAYLNTVSQRRTGIPLTSMRLTAADVAFMMVQMKQMRVLYGDETDPDNYVDAAGYTALAGMFAVPARRVAPGVSAAAVVPEQPPIPPFFNADFWDFPSLDPALSGHRIAKNHDYPVLPEGSKWPYKGHYVLEVGHEWPKGNWEVTHALQRPLGSEAFLLKPAAPEEA